VKFFKGVGIHVTTVLRIASVLEERIDVDTHSGLNLRFISVGGTFW
jgi:hypothetical protein